jgi:hypothetical protein
MLLPVLGMFGWVFRDPRYTPRENQFARRFHFVGPSFFLSANVGG